MWLSYTMPRIPTSNSTFVGDEGHADPLVRSALRQAQDQIGYVRAVVALCTTRLLMPIVATGESNEKGPDPHRGTEMAAVSVQSGSGERALLAFTGLDAMQAWNRAARPILCTLDDLCATALEVGAVALLLDIVGPATFIIEGETLRALAAGQRLIELDDGTFGWMSVSQPGEKDHD